LKIGLPNFEVEVKSSIAERLQFGFMRHLPIYRQTESGECGLACLAMIATYYGHKTDIPTLRQRYPFSQKGIKLPKLISIGASLKLNMRPVKLDIEELKLLRLPCILHWNMDHFVVLKKIGRKGIVIHDPAKGVRKYSTKELSTRFTGVAVELTPLPGFVRKVERERVHLRHLVGKVVGLKRSLLQISLLALALEVLSIVAPFFNQWVIDQVVVTRDLDLLVTLVFGFLLVRVISVAIDATRNWAVIIMSTNLNVQWLANLFSHLIRLPIGYFQKRQMGEVVSRFNAIHTIQATLTTSVIGAFLDGIMSIGTFVMMVIYSPMLSIAALVSMLLYLGLRAGFYSSLLSATESAIVYDAKQQSLFMETVRGIQSVRLFAKEQERITVWLNAVVDQKNASLRTQRLSLVFQTGNSLLSGVDEILLLAWGARMVIANEFSVGMLLAFIAYKNQFSSRLNSFIDRIFEFKVLKLQGMRLADIALAQPEIMDVPSGHDIESIEPSIQVENVSFSYGFGEKSVVRDVSFDVKAGEAVAIVGPSGSGKTTLMKLLLGIYHPKNGEINIGGVPLRKIGVASYRKIIGSVMQEDTLFSGTLSENISFFSADADPAWIEECARMAAIHDEIQAMPMGYNTLIGDLGTGLSGGQKQRVMLARALFCKPKILFLDEATSHLDIANEQLVSKVIKELKLTRVIVAHRAETIASVDRVITIDRGMSVSRELAA
jgi:ATP-binding cassette subfamily B protein RaxB